MSSDRYPVGARAVWPGEGVGTILPNKKMPGDICIQWDCGVFSSYDENFLIEQGIHAVMPAREAEQEREAE